jgi:hypothetical protein
MKAVLMAALVCGVSGAALAQPGNPGAHFVLNWDQDQNGAVSLDEAETKRDDLFTSFDADDDGFLSAEEYTAFDEMRAADQEAMREEMGTTAGGGMGMGQGNGVGQGMRLGIGKGMPEEGGMMRGFNDRDGDGRVSREEFTGRTAAWFKMMDRNGDGLVTEGDFGR